MTTNHQDLAKRFKTIDDALRYAPSAKWRAIKTLDWDDLPNQSFRDQLAIYVTEKCKAEGFDYYEYRDLIAQTIHMKLVWKSEAHNIKKVLS